MENREEETVFVLSNIPNFASNIWISGMAVEAVIEVVIVGIITQGYVGIFPEKGLVKGKIVPTIMQGDKKLPPKEKLQCRVNLKDH